MAPPLKLNFTIRPDPVAAGGGAPAPTAVSRVADAALSSSPNRDITLADKTVVPFQQFLKDVAEHPELLMTLFKKFSAIEFITFLTGGATNTEDVIADFSYFVRNLMPDSASTQAVGITTGENLFQGWYTVYKSWKAYQKARQIGDRLGIVEQGINAGLGTGQMIGGAAYVGVRATAIPVEIMSNPPAALVQASNIFTLIGNIAFTILYLGIAFVGSYLLHQDIVFGDEMQKVSANKEDMFGFLRRKAIADPMRKLEKLQAVTEKKAAYKEKLDDVVLSAMKEAGLSESEIRDLLNVIEGAEEKFKEFYAKNLGLEKTDLTKISATAMHAIGLNVDAPRRQAKKEAKFARVASGDSVKSIQDAAKRGLEKRMGSTEAVIKEMADYDVTEINEKVVAETKLNKIMHATLLALGALGVAIMILGFFPVLPVGVLIASTVLTAVLAGGMLVFDGFSMVTGWKEGKPGKYDEHYIIAISAVMLAAIIVSVGLTFGFGLAVLPAFLALGLGTVSLGLAGVSLYKLRKKKEDNPDLKMYSAQLADPELDDQRIAELFKKLEPKDRHEIRAEYKDLSFRKEKYKGWDSGHNFGEAALDQIDKMLADQQELALMVKALKKTTKFFWEQYQANTTRERFERAMQVQKSFDHARLVTKLKGKDDKRVQTLKEDIVRLKGVIKEDPAILARMAGDIWYVFKRQDSREDLKAKVDIVIEKRKCAAEQAKAAIKGSTAA